MSRSVTTNDENAIYRTVSDHIGHRADVTPAEAGVRNIMKRLDSVFRRNDGNGSSVVVGRLKSPEIAFP